MKDNALLLSRGLAAVPLLVLPMALGALWLALQPQAVPPRVLIIGGAVAVAWYLLAGLMVGQQLVQHARTRRQLRASRQMFAEQPGCAWIVDAEGAIRAQSPQAEQLHDLTGRDVAALLSRHRASPATTAQKLLLRVADGRPCELPLADGTRLLVAGSREPRCNYGGSRRRSRPRHKRRQQPRPRRQTPAIRTCRSRFSSSTPRVG